VGMQSARAAGDAFPQLKEADGEDKDK
jgi:hypothetical protein